MKLCRFRIDDDPRPRAGVFHDGKIYETDGEKALGVHVPETVELLTPIGHAASLRVYPWEGGPFVYANPGAIGPPEFEILFSETPVAGCDVFLAAIIGGSDRECTIEEAQSLVLGYTIMLAFSDGRPHYGPGSVLGPFVVTPEDVPALTGLKGRLHLGGEVVATVDVSPPVSFAEMIRDASRGADLREGDVIAVGPVPGMSLPDADRPLRDGDEVIAVIEKLGALGARIRL